MLANRSIPPSTVIPELAYPDVGAAADWLCAAFGFSVRLRIANHRIQLSVEGGGNIMLVNARGAGSDDPAAGVLVRVADIDAHHARAVAAGATILDPPADYPYGERQYAAEDLAGHRWKFSQSIADVDPADWGGSLSPATA